MYSFVLSSSAALVNAVGKTAPTNPNAPTVIQTILGLFLVYVVCSIFLNSYRKHSVSKVSNPSNLKS